MILKKKCDNVRKELRQEYNKSSFAVGTSKSAAKRRAKQIERCIKCGKFSHSGKCPKNQTSSNYEFITLCKEGPVKCYTEKLLNPRGYAYAKMMMELGRLTDKAQQRGL